MDPLLSSRLQSLRPMPALKLLEIAAPFLLIASRNLSSSERVQVIHYIMENWYEKQAKVGTEILACYPDFNYPDACFNCGTIFDIGPSNLRSHCRCCKTKGSYMLRFITGLIHQSYGIHPVQIEAAFAIALYNMRHNRHGN